MVKLSMNGDGTVFMFDEVLHGLQLTFEGFQNMCVAAGCDYLKNIHGVGIKRSFTYLASPQGQGHHNSVSQLLWARIT